MDGKKLERRKSGGGVLKALAGLVGRLGRLAETGRRLQRSGTFELTTEDGEKIQGEFAVSVRFGLGEEPPIRPGRKYANDQ